jgi:hypothetical protein
VDLFVRYLGLLGFLGCGFSGVFGFSGFSGFCGDSRFWWFKGRFSDSVFWNPNTKTMQVTDRDWFSQDQLCALSQDPKNRVFTFSVPTDPPKTLETQSWSTSQIKNTLLDLRKRFLQLKAAEPELTDDQIRSRLCAEKYIWKAFAREKSLNFQNATDSNTTDEKIKYQLYLLYLKDQLEKGQITEEQSRQMVTTFFLKETANKAKTHVTKQKDKKHDWTRKHQTG